MPSSNSLRKSCGECEAIERSCVYEPPFPFSSSGLVAAEMALFNFKLTACDAVELLTFWLLLKLSRGADKAKFKQFDLTLILSFDMPFLSDDSTQRGVVGTDEDELDTVFGGESLSDVFCGEYWDFGRVKANA